MSILDLVIKETGLAFRRKGSAGKEYCGPCPFCQAGDNRFLLWPGEDRYWCRRCDRKGDSIQFLRDYRRMGYREALQYLGRDVDTNHINDNVDTNDTNDTNRPRPASLAPPASEWAVQARAFLLECQAHLMERDTNPRALAWLHGRKLTDQVLRSYGVGYNPEDCYVDRGSWGLPPAQDGKGRPKRLWLPRGIVIPWLVDGELWGIRIRRPAGEPKYYWIPGGTPALFNADVLQPGRPAVLVEGEHDALTIAQVAGDMAGVAATGSTHGGRRTRWLARLRSTPAVLVAYDSDDAGEAASRYWLDALPNARRWRPYWSDPNDMARDGVDVRAWLAAGLQWAGLEMHPAPRAFQSFGEAWAYWEEVARGAGRLWLDKGTGQYRVATGG